VSEELEKINITGLEKASFSCPSCGHKITQDKVQESAAITPDTSMFLTLVCPKCETEWMPPTCGWIPERRNPPERERRQTVVTVPAAPRGRPPRPSAPAPAPQASRPRPASIPDVEELMASALRENDDSDDSE